MTSLMDLPIGALIAGLEPRAALTAPTAAETPAHKQARPDVVPGRCLRCCHCRGKSHVGSPAQGFDQIKVLVKQR